MLIGVEMAWFYAMAGSSVTLVEMMPRLLPLEDEEFRDMVFGKNIPEEV